MPRRDNLDRRRGKRRTRPLLLVVCAAERTERDYLWALRDSVAESPVDIHVVSKHKSPDAVVSYAVARARDSRTNYDEIWCVFDVDQYDRSVEIAKRKAAERGIRLAISNPCFELWLLLHREDCRSHLDGYRDVARRLKRHIPDYDKVALDFKDYSDGVEAAIRRAEKLGDEGNPSTGMWRLAMRIRDEEDDT